MRTEWGVQKNSKICAFERTGTDHFLGTLYFTPQRVDAKPYAIYSVVADIYKCHVIW